jgi:hypothetical protein
MGKVPVGERLKAYGLDEAHTKLDDLNIAAGVNHDLSAKNPAMAAHVKTLHPQSADDLRRWLGSGAHAAVPAVTTHLAPLTARSGVVDFHAIADITRPLPAALTAAHTAALYAAAHRYVLSNDHGLEPAVVANLNQWIVKLKPGISFYHFQDIHVAAGAKLTINAANSVLFARYITIEKTGKIVTKVSVAKIDCAGVRGH